MPMARTLCSTLVPALPVAALSGVLSLCAAGCGEDHEYVLVSGAGPDVPRDAWLDQPEVVEGDGASRFVSLPPPRLEYRRPSAPVLRAGVKVRGLPRAVLEGSRVYSLSIDAGLVVTDVADPLAPRVVARYPVDGEPVGLVVQDGIAHVLVNDASFLNSNEAPGYSCNGDACDTTRSHLLSVDTRQPDLVRKSSEHALNGTATNARRVGNALYVVSQTFEDCYECNYTTLEPRSILASFDIADPLAVRQIDELPFEGLAHRRFSFGEEQLYLVEQAWPPPGGTAGPVLHTFDLSTDGSAAPGPSAPLPIDLRLEDLRQAWPVVEAGDAAFVFRSEEDALPSHAFSRASGSMLEPIPIPEPTDESGAPLESWKLAGARLFGLTASGTLLAYDLSDASAPRRMGSIALPPVHDIAISGDRVLAWGGRDAASANLVLIDASNLSQPLVLDVQNGLIGGWTVDATAGLFVRRNPNVVADRAGYDELRNPTLCRAREPRVMTVLDPNAESLSARGEVEDTAAPFVAGERFLAAADRYFTSAPRAGRGEAAVRIELSRQVDVVRRLGEQIAAIGLESFTHEPTLDIGSSSGALASLGASTDAAAILGLPGNACEEQRAWGDRVFEFGAYAYVMRFHRALDASGAMTNDVVLTLHGIDRSNPGAPSAGASLTLPPLLPLEQYTGALSTDRALVLVRRNGNIPFRALAYATADRPAAARDDEPSEVLLHVDIVDLTDPAAPRLASSLELPRELAAGGWLEFADAASVDARWGWADGKRTAPLLTSGSLVIGQHAETLPDGRVSYYLDRLDVSDPSAPALLESINVPGHVLQLDAEAGWLVTLDTLSFEEHATSLVRPDCSSHGYEGTLSFDLSKRKQTCRLVRRALNGLRIEGDLAIRESQLVLDAGRRAIFFATSGDQLFYVTEPPLEQNADAFAKGDHTVSLERIRVRGGRFERLPSLDLRGQHRLLPRHWQTALARGERFYSVSAGELGVVDFGVEPPALSRYTLPASGCLQLEVAGETAYCALGPRGFASVALGAPR